MCARTGLVSVNCLLLPALVTSSLQLFAELHSIKRFVH